MTQDHPQISDREEKASYSFGNFSLSADGQLQCKERPLHISPKELAALRLFLAHAGQIVTPQQLRTAIWGDVHVTDESVPKCVSSLRALLGAENFIETVYKQGYRFSVEHLSRKAFSGPTLPRIAILPFFTEYGVPEYLGEYVAEEAMTRLSGLRPTLAAVIARDSIFTLARRKMAAQEIGQALAADFALAGTIRALPKQFRLRAELIRIADGIQVWVEDILVDREKPESLEDTLAELLIFRLSGIQATTSVFDLSASASSPQEAPNANQREAHVLYQRGHSEWQTLQRHRMQDSLQHLLRATELNPERVEIWVDLIYLCVTQEFFGFMAPSVAVGITRRAVAKIPDLEIRAEKMLPALGWLEFHAKHNFGAAQRLFSLSAHLPHSPSTTRCRVMFLLSRRCYGEALDLVDEALMQDPFSPWLGARRGWILHLMGEAEASVAQTHAVLKKYPGLDAPALYGALILAYNGEVQEATALAKDLAQRLPFFDLATAVHAYALAKAERQEEARAILERLEWLSHERFVISSHTPAVWMALRDPEAAVAALQAAERTRCPWFFLMLNDPRLQELENNEEVRRMKRIVPLMEAETGYDEASIALDPQFSS